MRNKSENQKNLQITKFFVNESVETPDRCFPRSGFSSSEERFRDQKRPLLANAANDRARIGLEISPMHGAGTASSSACSFKTEGAFFGAVQFSFGAPPWAAGPGLCFAGSESVRCAGGFGQAKPCGAPQHEVDGCGQTDTMAE